MRIGVQFSKGRDGMRHPLIRDRFASIEKPLDIGSATCEPSITVLRLKAAVRSIGRQVFEGPGADISAIGSGRAVRKGAPSFDETAPVPKIPT